MEVKIQQPFTFSANPQKIIFDKRLSHEPNSIMSTSVYKNLMHESSVIRGNTNSLSFHKKYGFEIEKNEQKPKIIVTKISEKVDIQKSQQELSQNMRLSSFETQSRKNESVSQRGSLLKRMSAEVKNRGQNRFGPNRESREVYVDDKIRLETDFLDCVETGIQTDPTPPKKLPNLDYVFKIGTDAEVQVIEAEIFDFELESAPIVFALRSRIIKESYEEVQFEVEIDKLKELKNRTLLNAKAVEFKEEEYFKAEETKKRKQIKVRDEFIELKEGQLDVSRKMITRVFAKKVLGDLDSDVEEYVQKLGGDLDPKFCKLNGELKEDVYRGIAKLQNSRIDFKQVATKMVEGSFSELLKNAERKDNTEIDLQKEK